MPYPWFQRQWGLYPKIHFPEILKTASTYRYRDGNTQLLLRFLRSNIDSFDIYIDQHAIVRLLNM